MTAIGYLLIAAAILIARQVVVGRVSTIGTDLKDFTVDLLSGDLTGAGEVASRRGENVPVSPVTSGDTGTDSSSILDGGNSAYARKVMELGDAADGYIWGATGPNAYDCSGLLWRAMVTLKLYDGPRFTTDTFSTSVGPRIGTEVSTPDVGDIVVWDGQHMGVYIGGGDYYSARSRSKGIGTSTVSGDSGYFGKPARYWRIGGDSVAT